MSEKLKSELKKLTENGWRKTALEDAIGIPKNSLSAVLKGHKEMPSKWAEKVQAFLDKAETQESDFFKAVMPIVKEPPTPLLDQEIIVAAHKPTNAEIQKLAEALDMKIAAEVPPPPPKVPDWVKQVEDYCSEAGITPADLILAHKTPKTAKKEKKVAETSNKAGENSFYDRRKSKLGF